ncbi:MAG: serine/threonine-protein kinase [Lentisphaeria bacterium]
MNNDNDNTVTINNILKTTTKEKTPQELVKVHKEDYIKQGSPLQDYHKIIHIDGYKLLAILGEGGMGTVFLASQPRLNRLVAIKMLNQKHAHNPIYINMLRQEAQTIGSVNHPNIVSCHDVISNDCGIFLVMEFIPGHLTGKNLVKRFGPLPENIVIGILLEVVRGLSYILDQGIIHKDLKPENILFFWQENTPPENIKSLFDSQTTRVKICDFGIADQRNFHVEKDYQNKVLGTPAFMAPEQAFLDEKLNQCVDIYSLASTAYYFLTGEIPFKDEKDPEKCLKLKCQFPLRLPAKIKKNLHPDFVKILSKMGEIAPVDRYQNYHDLTRDLQNMERKYGGLKGSAKNTKENYKNIFLGIFLTILCFGIFFGGKKGYEYWKNNLQIRQISQTLTFFFWEGNMKSWSIIQDDINHFMSILSGSQRSDKIKLRKIITPEQTLEFNFRQAGQGVSEWIIADSEDNLRCIISFRRYTPKIMRLIITIDGKEISHDDIPDFSQFDWSNFKFITTDKHLKIYLNHEIIALGYLKKPLGNWTFSINPNTAKILQFNSLFVYKNNNKI